MKKISLLLVLFIATITATQAQHVFNKGDLAFNAGIGIPHSYGFIPSINFSGEYGAIPTGDIGIVSFGGLAEFQLGQHDWVYDNEMFPRFFFGARAAWHLQVFESDVWDVYGGAGLGITINGKSTYHSGWTNVDPDVFVGGKWMFSEGMGLFAEVGYTGLSNIKFGITFGL